MKIFKALALLVICIAMTSCKVPKNITYMQGYGNGQTEAVATPVRITVQPDDKLAIVVTSKDPELAVAFNDVDFCLKAGKAGYRVVYDPYAELYHDESRTRGPEDTPEKVKRFQSEIEYMRKHWIDILKNGDPNYNKNLSLKKWNYSLRV